MFTTTKQQNQLAGQTLTTLALRMAWQMNQPLGFNAGQSNLFQYVGNDPTDGTDPTGLVGDEKHAETWPGTGDPVVIDPATFEFTNYKGEKDIGTIRVTKNIALNYKGALSPDWIELKFTASKPVGPNVHWVQRIAISITDNAGEPVQDISDYQGYLGVNKANGKHIWLKNENPNNVKYVIDTTKENNIYYDEVVPSSTRREPNGLAIYDKPTLFSTDEGVKGQDQTWFVETYLVIDGKFYFGLTWRVESEWKKDHWTKPVYTNIHSRVLKETPQYFIDEKLNYGYRPDDLSNRMNLIQINNPFFKKKNQ